MAFFGITALGAPNPFKNLSFFDTILPEDWRDAFEKLKEDNSVSADRMELLLLEAAGHQEAPQAEKDLYFTIVRESGKDSFSWKDLGEIISGIASR